MLYMYCTVYIVQVPHLIISGLAHCNSGPRTGSIPGTMSHLDRLAGLNADVISTQNTIVDKEHVRFPVQCLTLTGWLGSVLV